MAERLRDTMTGAHTLSPAGSRYRGEDRRTTHPLLVDWKYAIKGRRHTVRRDEDQGFVQKDHTKPEVLLLIVAVMFLSTLDAIFTLWLIDAGVVIEANPIMRYFLEQDVQLFANMKTVFTGSALIILAACADLEVFGKFRVESVLYLVLGIYGLLMSYHAALLVSAGLV